MNHVTPEGGRLSHDVTNLSKRAIWAISLGTGLSLLGDSALYTVLPTHTAQAGVLLTAVGVLLSANRFIRLFSNNALGWLCDRWPRRRLFVPALFLGAISTAFYAFTVGFWPMLAGRLLWGIAWSGIWVTGNAIIFDISDDNNRGRWVGIYQISFFSGAAMGALSGGVLTDWLGFHGAMTAAAGFNLVGALIAWVLLPETSRRTEAVGLQMPSVNGAWWRGKWSRLQELLAGFRQRPQLMSAVGLLSVNRIVIAGMFISTVSVLIASLLGNSVMVDGRTIGVSSITGAVLAVNTLFSVIFTPTFGAVSDRLGSRWRVAVWGLAAGVIGFGLLWRASPWFFLLAFPLTAVASSSNQGLSTALVGDFSAEVERGRILGVMFTMGDMGSALGPPLAFAILPIWGISAVYGVCTLLFLLMFFTAAYWRRIEV
ncbi:MAG: MFS transporter [Anaerolineae bacterium]